MRKYALFLNSLTRVLLLLVGVIIAFVMSPVIVHGLGNHNYGIWELLGTLVSYLALLELGTGSAMVRYIADSLSRKDLIALQQIFNTGLFALIGMGMLSLLFCSFFMLRPEYLLSLGVSGRIQEYSLVLLILGLNLSIKLPEIAVISYSFGLQAHRFIDILRIIILIMTNVAIYQIIIAGWDRLMVWMSLVTLFSTICESILVTCWIVFVDRRIRIKISFFSLSILKKFFEYGSKNMTLIAAELMVRKLVNFVIAYTSGVGQIVYFVISNRLVEYAQSVGLALVSPLIPYFADTAGRGDQTALQQSWFQITRICQIITFGIWVAMVGLGEPFIRVWMGEDYANRGEIVFYILCIGLFSQTIASNSNQLLQSLNKHGLLALYVAILALGFFLASIGLGWRWNIEGVAAAVSGFNIAFASIEIILAGRSTNVSVFSYLRATLIRFIIPIIVTGGVFICQRLVAYPKSYGELLLHSILPCIIYLATVWLIVLDPFEKKLIWNIIAGRSQARLAKASQLPNCH